MSPIHPDDARSTVQLRQAIVRQGMLAARHPGDLAGFRERIGLFLIGMGQRIQGRQPTYQAAIPRRQMRPAL